MAVEIKVGDVITDIKRGTSAKGEWGFAVAKAEKGSSKITVWFDNPADIDAKNDFAVEIVEISSAKQTAKQYPENSGKWYPIYTVNAKVKAVSSGAKPIDDPLSGFEQIDDSDVPF